MIKKEKIKSKDSNYVGEVKNGKPHGKGKLEKKVDETIDVYVGEFKKGKFHGKGTLTEDVLGYYGGYHNNPKHIGLWKNGKPIKGKTIYKDGTKYEGEWTNENLAQGKGKITYPNGSYFVGSFYYDEPKIGKGVLYFDNSKYVGQIKTIDHTVAQHGKGITTFKNGDILEGQYNNGRPIKALKYVYFTKDIKWEYKGNLNNDGPITPNGKGVLKTISSKNKMFIIEEGNFKKNELDGRGSRIYYLGKNFKKHYYIYKGEFKKGKLHGKGIEIRYIGSKEGSIKHEGFFKKDKFVRGKITKF